MKPGDSLVGRSERIPRGVPCSETKDGGREEGRKETNTGSVVNHPELLGSFT